ncbi:MAG TPA: 3'-5' exonuclease [Crocinitomicaceae bacterium]|nr:3'-5' exonuclease [Crocinitomicaceae bacterium]
MSTYLDELNKSQRDAVVNYEGPSMVIAGAGSGKTRVLTYRIAHMIDQGVDPFNILALTFTNKAAAEMKERITQIVGDSNARSVMMGTFHSVFSRILRMNSDRLGFPQNFTIYDTQDSKSLLKDIVKELNLDDKLYKPSVVYNRISSAKNQLISADDYANNSEIMSEDYANKRPMMAMIFKTYTTRCYKAGAMDFDDLLFYTNVLLRDFPDVLQHYQYKFRYILVDEYQDTNFAQYLIVKKLAAVFENICVVGDDAQSIYSFRGANIQNILNFRKDYPDFKLYKLEQNYRSTQVIVEAANSIIKNNKDQIHKNVWTNNSQGAAIKIVRTLTDNEEGKMVADRIFDMKQAQGLAYKDFAILYRTNRQSRAFEESLRKLNLPYKIYGGMSLYQRKEIKDLLAYFRLSSNLNDEEALKRVINYPKRGIGKTTLENVVVKANEQGISIFEALSNDAVLGGIAGGTRTKIMEFTTMIKSFHAEIDKLPAYEMAMQIAKSSGILKELYNEKDKGPEEVERYQNLEELLGGVKTFSQSEENQLKTLPEFLIDVALLTDADEQKDEDRNKISLMTIHSSKGLEFKHVFLVGLEENLFPSQMSITTRADLEEERRLFYVALTRAEETCTISYANSRFVFGRLETAEPSRFISEIDQQYTERETTIRGGSGRSLKSGRIEEPTFSGGLSRFKTAASHNLRSLDEINKSAGTNRNPTQASDLSSLKVGYNVQHESFGKGKVIQITGNGDDKRAVIFFPKEGSKTLLLRFAKLEILEE